MDNKLVFTEKEKEEFKSLAHTLRNTQNYALTKDDEICVFRHLRYAIENNKIQRDLFGLNPIILSLQTAIIAIEEIGLKRDGTIAVLLYPCVSQNETSEIDSSIDKFGDNVKRILRGLVHIQELYKKNPVIESENFRNLLLSFAEDMRVILIMIADRVNLMRQIRDTENIEAKQRVSEEASYLYAPLAHKLGLYKLKSELEDLSLKYLEHDAYYMIKDKLNETKASRDKYIESFIAPIKKKLEHEEHTQHLAEDEKAEMRLRRHLRPLCHKDYPRHTA